MRQSHALRKATSVGLKAAVHRAKAMSRAGALERMFTFTFSNLVYPQIWEDPIVDMRALEIGRGHEVIAIASGGCNVLSYLLDDPGRVTAVDLNGAHVGSWSRLRHPSVCSPAGGRRDTTTICSLSQKSQSKLVDNDIDLFIYVLLSGGRRVLQFDAKTDLSL